MRRTFTIALLAAAMSIIGAVAALGFGHFGEWSPA